MTESLRTAQKAFTRQRLLDAAADSFVLKGYAATTIDDIVTAAGATRATFYLHFSSKSELSQEIWKERIEQRVAELWGSLPGALSELDDSSDGLRAWLGEVVTYWDSRGPIALALMSATSSDPDLESRLNEQRQLVAGIISNARAPMSRHSSRGLRIRSIAAFELLTAMFAEWIREDVPRDKQGMIDALADGWLALLR